MTASAAPTPLKILLAADGSTHGERAVVYIEMLTARGVRIELHVLNVQQPLRGDVSTFVPRKDIEQYHREEGLKALGPVLTALDRAGITHQWHVGVGAAAETILAFARDLGCDQVVIGTRGLGAVSSLVMGSVANDVVRHATLPVTLIK